MEDRKLNSSMIFSWQISSNYKRQVNSNLCGPLGLPALTVTKDDATTSTDSRGDNKIPEDIVTPRPSITNGPSTSAFSARSKSLFTDHAITTRIFPVLWPHSHAIANHFPIGHPFFHYSSSSTLNSGVLSGCAPEKVAKSIMLSLFTYHNSGCYNSPPLKERNVLVAAHDRSQDASQVSTEMANLALIPLVTPRPPTTNGPPTPALSARGPHPVRRSVR
ncbi:hypothetical protein YC2023_007054 [Brassica napus]